jgi:hypothetical protein
VVRNSSFVSGQTQRVRGDTLCIKADERPDCNRQPCYNQQYAVGVAQLAEHRTVAPDVVGSIPISHPTSKLTEEQQVDTDYKAAIEAFNALVGTDVAAFNSAMSGRKLPGVIAGEALQP